jgi:putative glycosyltransferase (TIGR04372 family)
MPFRIFAYVSVRALGDVVLFAWFVSSVAELFDDAELTVYFHDDRPYKSGIISCIRNAKRILKPTSLAARLPIEIFDVAGGAPAIPTEFDISDVSSSNLVLVQPMFQEGMLNSIPLTAMAPPPETIESSDKALMELGLDPDRWVATVFWKEPGYGFRPPEPSREIADPGPYIAAIRHIIENLGGQVVRLGHPSPTELPKLKGLIDLANAPNSEWLQLYSVWISRFMLSSNSGPLSYGPAFNVPTLLTDQRSCLAVYRSHDYVVTQGIIHDGTVYRGLEAFSAGLLKRWGTKPERYVMNTAAEIVAAVDEMYQSTASCLGWRAHPVPQPPLKRPNKLVWPIPEDVRRPELFIPPSQRVKV